MRNRFCHGLIMLLTFVVAFSVLANSDQTEREIQHLLSYISQSQCRFIRNGKEYGGDEACKHIQQKYDYARRRIKTCEDFIRHVATKSSVSGKAYQVRCNDQLMPCAAWLGAELARFRQYHYPKDRFGN